MNIQEFSKVFLLQTFRDFDHNLEEKCCICFEDILKFKDGVCLPCCKHMIHPCCLIKSTFKSCIKCPLCRCDSDFISRLSEINKILLATMVKLSIETLIIQEQYEINHFVHTQFQMNTKIILNKIGTFYNNIEEDFIQYLTTEFSYKIH
jgi:hypothetical protein